MFGHLVLDRGGWGAARRGELYGLAVVRAEAGGEGWLGGLRLRRAGRSLRRAGVLRALVPPDFRGWEVLEGCGLGPVDPAPLLRAQSVPLALAALERRGLAPDRAAVALRGDRAGAEMARTAAALCPRVRTLVISAPRGGAELAAWLRWEFGVPILPPDAPGAVALRFSPGPAPPAETGLELYGPAPDLAGMALTAPGLAEEDRARLPLLAALWEGGRLGREGIKIT